MYALIIFLLLPIHLKAESKIHTVKKHVYPLLKTDIDYKRPKLLPAKKDYFVLRNRYKKVEQAPVEYNAVFEELNHEFKKGLFGKDLEASEAKEIDKEIREGYVVKGSDFRGVLNPDKNKKYAWVKGDILLYYRPGKKESVLRTSDKTYYVVPKNTFVEVEEYKTIKKKKWAKIKDAHWVRAAQLNSLYYREIPKKIKNRAKWMDVDLNEQTLIAYIGAKPIFATKISSGTKKYPTVEGLFPVTRNFKRTRMIARKSKKTDFYDLRGVPHSLYFYKGQALHGTYWHDDFGTARSHGCINASLSDAEWLYNWVVGPSGRYTAAVKKVKIRVSSK